VGSTRILLPFCLLLFLVRSFSRRYHLLTGLIFFRLELFSSMSGYGIGIVGSGRSMSTYAGKRSVVLDSLKSSRVVSGLQMTSPG